MRIHKNMQVDVPGKKDVNDFIEVCINSYTPSLPNNLLMY